MCVDLVATNVVQAINIGITGQLERLHIGKVPI